MQYQTYPFQKHILIPENYVGAHVLQHTKIPHLKAYGRLGNLSDFGPTWSLHIRSKVSESSRLSKAHTNVTRSLFMKQMFFSFSNLDSHLARTKLNLVILLLCSPKPSHIPSSRRFTIYCCYIYYSLLLYFC